MLKNKFLWFNLKYSQFLLPQRIRKRIEFRSMGNGKYPHSLDRINTYALTEDNNAVHESVIEPSIFLSHGSQEDDSQRHKYQSYWKQGKKKFTSASAE